MCVYFVDANHIFNTAAANTSARAIDFDTIGKGVLVRESRVTFVITTMAPVLGYWDIRCFASPIRNLLHYKEVEFVDKLYQIGPAPEFNIAEWTAVKPTLGLDFPNVPYYIDGEIKLSQVNL